MQEYLNTIIQFERPTAYAPSPDIRGFAFLTSGLLFFEIQSLVFHLNRVRPRVYLRRALTLRDDRRIHLQGLQNDEPDHHWRDQGLERY